jgi:hypothetical protein
VPSATSLSALQFQKAAVVLLSVSVDPDQMSLLASKIRQLKVGCVPAYINPFSVAFHGRQMGSALRGLEVMVA